MESEEIARLKYRRQYLITPKRIPCPFEHEIRTITDTYFLYVHIDLKVTECVHDNTKLLLLGDIFDYESPRKSNSEILQDLINADFEQVLENSSKYSGRFVCVYIQDSQIFLFHDAVASRKIYYCQSQNNLWFSSQPHLLANILNLNRTKDNSKLEYYYSEDFIRFLNANVGDTTYYDEVNQLLPNHFISVNNFKIVRYWPNAKIEHKTMKAAAVLCAKMIKGFMESIASRYEIMLPLTAGKDSRTLLAGAFHIKDQIYIYSNKLKRLNDSSPDIAIPKKLLSKLNLKFNILDPYIPVEEEFKEVYFINNPFASNYYLPIIYNYYLNHSEKVNLPGNSVADQEYIFNVLAKKLTPGDFTELSGLGKYEFADKYFAKWFSDSYPACLEYNVNPMSLFYWEHRLTNCIMQIQIDKDIAQDEFNPFNSRQLISQYLSVKPKHILSPDYRFHKEVMKRLWPDVLKLPINPSRNFYLKGIFKMMGLLKIFYKLRYSLNQSLDISR